MISNLPLFLLHPIDDPATRVTDVVKIQFPEAELFDDINILCNAAQQCNKQCVILYVAAQGYERSTQFYNYAQTLCNHSRYVVLFIDETLQISHSFESLISMRKLLIVTPAQHNHGPRTNKFVTWQRWFQNLVDHYSQPEIAQYINSVDPYQAKQYDFDVMLGSQRPYRDKFYEWISGNASISTSCFLTYFHKDITSFLQEPGVVPVGSPFAGHTGAKVRFLNNVMNHSEVPPVSIYKDCAYSIVTETAALSNWNFYTEKVAKPLACKRLFIAVGGQHYLQFLRESGFRTFDGIINESYDLEPDDSRRYQLAFDQLVYLTQQPQQEIFEQIRPIVEHNHRVLFETNWHQKMSQQVRTILTAKLNLEPT